MLKCILKPLTHMLRAFRLEEQGFNKVDIFDYYFLTVLISNSDRYRTSSDEVLHSYPQNFSTQMNTGERDFVV